MEKDGLISDALISQAYSHLHEEIGLDNIKYSLEIEFDGIQKAHDAIHEFMMIARLLFPDDDSISWHRKSAFLVYHWDAFSLAHRSLLEALCANYNAASILLRSTMELIIKGAFLECMSRKKFRDNSMALDKDKKGNKFKEKMVVILSQDQHVVEELEKTSGLILDIIASFIDNSKYRIALSTIIDQLDQWKILEPITNPKEVIYENIFRDLSASVHVVPDKTDIGRRLLMNGDRLFGQEVLHQELNYFSHTLLKLMDVAIVIELNIMEDLLNEYAPSRDNLYGRLAYLEQLNLKYSIERLGTLTKDGWDMV